MSKRQNGLTDKLISPLSDYNEGIRSTRIPGPTQATMFSFLFGGSRRSLLLRAGLLIVAIALIDWRAADELPLGFLYLLPMLMVGRVLTPIQIAGVATLCTFLTELLDAFVWNVR